MEEYKQILDELRIQVNMLGVDTRSDHEDIIIEWMDFDTALLRIDVDIAKSNIFQILYDTDFSKNEFIKRPALRTLPLTVHNLKRVCKCMLIIATRIAKEKT